MKFMSYLIISLILLGIFILDIPQIYAQYSSNFIQQAHYPPMNDTTIKLLVINSTEFKAKISGRNYTFTGIDYNWIPKQNNYYSFGGARVNFMLSGLDNGTTREISFVLDSKMKVQSVFEYDINNPPRGYESGFCYGCLLPSVESKGNNSLSTNETKSVTTELPLEQVKAGIKPQAVECMSGFVLLLKFEGDSPACVTPQTAHMLIERGWGHYPLRLH